MDLRVIDWNVNGRRDVAKQLALMDDLVPLLRKRYSRHPPLRNLVCCCQ